MWINRIEEDVFSRVKRDGVIALKSTFPKIRYTAENASDDNAVFPTVFIQELSGSEVGQDITGTSINAIESIFQVDVSDNQQVGKQNCKLVMSKVIESMKSMHYQIKGTPIYRKEEDVWIGTARFTRIIGFNDIL